MCIITITSRCDSWIAGLLRWLDKIGLKCSSYRLMFFVLVLNYRCLCVTFKKYSVEKWKAFYMYLLNRWKEIRIYLVVSNINLFIILSYAFAYVFHFYLCALFFSDFNLKVCWKMIRGVVLSHSLLYVASRDDIQDISRLNILRDKKVMSGRRAN